MCGLLKIAPCWGEWKWRQEGPWSLLSSQSSQMVRLQIQWETQSQKVVWRSIEENAWCWGIFLWSLQESEVYLHTWTSTYAYPSNTHTCVITVFFNPHFLKMGTFMTHRRHLPAFLPLWKVSYWGGMLQKQSLESESCPQVSSVPPGSHVAPCLFSPSVRWESWQLTLVGFSEYQIGWWLCWRVVRGLGYGSAGRVLT